MKCAHCGIDAPTMEHHFFEGIAPAGRTKGQKSKREWVIIAPLYFRANEDNTVCIEGYCGVECGIKRYGVYSY